MKLWLYKLATNLAWAVCESLMLLHIDLPTAHLKDEYGCTCHLWCFYVHNPLEMKTWAIERNTQSY